MASRGALTASLVAAAIGLTAPQPADAIPGLVRAENNNNGYPPDPSPVKQVVAGCPKGHHILGGGAQINEPGAVRHVRLTRLEPVEHSHPFDEHDDLFHARAEAFDLSFVHDWSLTAYAICAYKANLQNWQPQDGARFQRQRLVSGCAHPLSRRDGGLGLRRAHRRRQQRRPARTVG